MPRITVWLDEAKVEALRQLAIIERRRTADQAAVVIEEALQSRSKEAVTT